MSEPGTGRTGAPGDAAPAPGLSTLYTALHTTVLAYGLDAFAVAVDDPDLGHQCFAAGADARAALTALAADPGQRWVALPATADPPAELEALHGLAATALRLSRIEPEGDPASTLEAFVRGVPHVVTVLRTGSVVEAVVVPGHRDDVVTRLAAADLPGRGAVIVHDAGAPGPDPGADVGPLRRAELIAVRSLPETGELEVHLRGGEHRSIGRGPLARAGQAAAAATLDALAELEPGPFRGAPWRVGWVRTIDTTPDREFLVAVMIRRDRERALYGLAAGTSPIEAAARATLHACNRAVGLPTTD